jgi:acetyltransferase-like isoleucine patch superfamily enzyme
MAEKLLRYVLATSLARLTTRMVIGVGFQLGRIASYARTRLLFPNAPDVVCHWSTEVKYPENITFGQRVIVGTHCTLGAGAPIYIGDDVVLSKGVFLETGTADVSTPPPYTKMAKSIRIEKGVWLGAYAMVMPGVTIGENSIIASGVIVRKSVPANSFVVDERPRVQAFARV